MPSWEEKAKVGPWFIAYRKEVSNPERRALGFTGGLFTTIYWYIGGPYSSLESAKAANIGEQERSISEPGEYSPGAYVVISCAQLKFLTGDQPHVADPYMPQAQRTKLEDSNVQGFPKDCFGERYWWSGGPEVQLECPRPWKPGKLRDA